MNQAPRKYLDHTIYLALLRGCGVAGVLGGVLFGVWGYLDKPNISENRGTMVEVLAFVIPILFLGTVVGLSGLWKNHLGVFGWIGMALAGYGLCWSIVASVVGIDSVWIYFAQKGWPHYLHNWLLCTLTGLTLVGLAFIRGKSLRRVGTLVLMMVIFGWGYYWTDTGAVLEARIVHVGFGLLFSAGWIALGVGLLGTRIRRVRRPKTG